LILIRRPLWLVVASIVAMNLPAMAARSDDELTVNDYLDIRDGRNRMGEKFLPTYLGGLLEGLLTFNSLVQQNGVQVFCVPEAEGPMGAAMFRTKIDELIEEARTARPDFKTYASEANIGVMGLFVLNRTYPCHDQESAPDSGAGSTGGEGGGGTGN
jgi:hypothetical protein